MTTIYVPLVLLALGAGWLSGLAGMPAHYSFRELFGRKSS